MNSNTGLKLLVVVLFVLCTALGIRVFRPNPVADGTYTLGLGGVKMKGPHPQVGDVQAATKNATKCTLLFMEDKPNAVPTPACAHQSNLPGGIKNGAPHIQQTATYSDAASLQQLVNLLDGTTSNATDAVAPASGANSPPTTSSPAPHVQQTAGIDTPRNQKAITAALQQ